MGNKLTKRQRAVALLILLSGAPLALPLSLLAGITAWLADTFEALYDWVGQPFIGAHRSWIIRCERVNSALQSEKEAGK